MFPSGTVLGQGPHERRWYRCGVALVRKCCRFGRRPGGPRSETSLRFSFLAVDCGRSAIWKLGTPSTNGVRFRIADILRTLGENASAPRSVRSSLAFLFLCLPGPTRMNVSKRILGRPERTL